MYRWLLLLLFISLSGCISKERLTENRIRVSSGHIGCAEESIRLSDEKDTTWVAHCADRKFYCVVRHNFTTGEQKINCAEAID